MGEYGHTKLGRYHILEPIGRGSMGTVYLSHDPFHDRAVALKVAHEPAYRDANTRALFRSLFFNEMRAASMLAHPSIVSVFDAGKDGDSYYIAMEYVRGARTLEDWCRGGELLALERVTEVVLKCAQALDHAHRQGVIHRDVKPANVLVGADGEVKLADFSVALLTDPHIDETQMLEAIGSPAYMSPEQLSNEALTSSTDLYSLGTVLYELITGRLPFPADTVAGITHQVLNLVPPPVSQWRPDVPPALAAVVTRALTRKPQARYADALEMAADLSMVFADLHHPHGARAVEGRVGMVRRVGFFDAFRDAEIWELLRWAEWLEFGAGEAIVTEGRTDDSVYVLLDGEVDVIKDGRVVRTLPAGECFGEIAYLSKRRRSASVSARTAATVLKLNADAIARASLDCQVQFQRVFIETLIERLVHTTEDLVRGH